MNDKILIVDDETSVLLSLKRVLLKEFRIETAASGQEALKALESSGPYAVVLSDLRMPGMTGIDLLALVKLSWPDTVRILLTGHVELDAAVRAVNLGYIYRFLMKPCPTSELTAALRAALDQYHQGIAEREVLEQTLMGALTVLTEILGMVHPAAFGRVGALRRYACHMASDLNMPEPWRVEAAALLSQIGLISVPSETVEKYYVDEPLTHHEASAFASHPRVGHGLLEGIPRLKTIAGMIRGQQEPYRRSQEDQSEADASAALGAHILHAALAFEQLAAAGHQPSSALTTMRKRSGEYEPRLLESLAKLEPVDPEVNREQVSSVIDRRSAQGEFELPSALIATQVWDLLNDQAGAAQRSHAHTHSCGASSSEYQMPRPPSEVVEDLLTSLNDEFDALYLGLPACEERIRLREVYVLARDAFCGTAGKAFDRQRDSSTRVAEKLALALARMHESSGRSESLPQRLHAFATAVDLSTQLASLADERPKAGFVGTPTPRVRSGRSYSCDL